MLKKNCMGFFLSRNCFPDNLIESAFNKVSVFPLSHLTRSRTVIHNRQIHVHLLHSLKDNIEFLELNFLKMKKQLQIDQNLKVLSADKKAKSYVSLTAILSSSASDVCRQKECYTQEESHPIQYYRGW